MNHRIRPARQSEAGMLREIERAAGRRFADIGLDAVAGAEPTPADVLIAAARARHLLVGVDGHDRPCGFALFGAIDGLAHLRELSVHPDHAGRRLGAALVEAVTAWAREAGLPALVLTTFREVPWNGPYYRRLGFSELPAEAQGPGIAAILAAEAALGLAGRCAMSRRLDTVFS